MPTVIVSHHLSCAGQRDALAGLASWSSSGTLSIEKIFAAHSSLVCFASLSPLLLASSKERTLESSWPCFRLGTLRKLPALDWVCRTFGSRGQSPCLLESFLKFLSSIQIFLRIRLSVAACLLLQQSMRSLSQVCLCCIYWLQKLSLQIGALFSSVLKKIDIFVWLLYLGHFTRYVASDCNVMLSGKARRCVIVP